MLQRNWSGGGSVLKSTQPNVQSLFMIDQQGNPAQGAQYFQRVVATTLSGTGWQTMTATMCETSPYNQTVSAYVGSQTANVAVYVDDVTISMAPDTRFVDEGGCVARPIITPGGGGGGGPTQPPAPDGAHYFENGVPTTIDVSDDARKCLVGNGAVSTNRNACLVVVPREYGPGWYLEIAGSPGSCFGKVSGTLLVGTVPCLSVSNLVRDDVVITDGPGQYDLAFPIRKAKLSGSPPEDYNKCLTLVADVATFSPCGVVPTSNQMWFDAADVRAYALAPNSKPPTLTPTESLVWDQIDLVYDTAADTVNTFRNQPPSASVPDRKPTLQGMSGLFGPTLQEVLLRCTLGRNKCIGVTFQIFNFAHWTVQLDLAKKVGGTPECRIPGTLRRVDVVAGTCAAPGSIVEVKPDTAYSLNVGAQQLNNYVSLYGAAGLTVLRGPIPPWPSGGGYIGLPYTGAGITYRNAGSGLYAYTFDPRKLVPVISSLLLYNTLKKTFRDLSGTNQPSVIPETAILVPAVNGGRVGNYVAYLIGQGMSSMNAWLNASFQFSPEQINAALVPVVGVLVTVIIILWLIPVIPPFP